MKYADIKGMNFADLISKKKELNDELFQTKMKNCFGRLNNPLVIRQLRKDMARINTALKSLKK